ncbi:MAG: zinc ribbon domain-containing protein [Planctomycetes bacterium]|nr:zinc ribbon domain-containing protein [Planctomycetota bacterium]
MAARFCSGCGAQLVEGARFCAGCGASTTAAPTPAAAPVSPGLIRRGFRACAIAFLILIIAFCAAVFVQEKAGIRLLPRFGAAAGAPGMDPERGARLDARVREANRTLRDTEALASTWTASIDSATFPDLDRLTKLRDDLRASVAVARAKAQDVVTFVSENADALQGQDESARACMTNLQMLERLESLLKGVRFVLAEVHARVGWTGAGARVEAGEVVRVWSRGLWRASPECPWVGPDGATGVNVPGEWPGWEVPLMSLIARTSRDAGAGVFVAGKRSVLTIATGGDLELACADADPTNNQGGVEVFMVVLPRSP